MNNNANCKTCGRFIGFEKTVNGKLMPVDLPSVRYYPYTNGKYTILTESGETVKGIILNNDDPGSLKGYIPHFITCAGYKESSDDKGKEPKNNNPNQISMYDPPSKPAQKTDLTDHKPRLSESDTAFEVFRKMCDGNPYCMMVLKELLQKTKHDDSPNGLGYIYYLDSIGIYGKHAYTLWNTCCSRDTEKMELVLLNHRAGQLSTEELHATIDNGYTFQYLLTIDELREIIEKRGA
jgi:hypothetical protein